MKFINNDSKAKYIFLSHYMKLIPLYHRTKQEEHEARTSISTDDNTISIKIQESLEARTILGINFPFKNGSLFCDNHQI